MHRLSYFFRGLITATTPSLDGVAKFFILGLIINPFLTKPPRFLRNIAASL